MPTLAAASGRSGENAKKAALPEPVTTVATTMIVSMMSSITHTPADSMEAAMEISVLMPPSLFMPSAKSSAQQMRPTVEVKTLPMPSKTAWVFFVDSRKERRVMKSTTKAMMIETMRPVCSESLMPS